jgi:hypothetical protein
MTAALFSQANVGVGAVVVSVLGGIFWGIGWLGDGVTGAGVVAVAIGIAVLARYGRGGARP